MTTTSAGFSAGSLLHEGRASGVLLHPTSLPGAGIGDLGAASCRFVEWLSGAGQSCWQILPLVDADEGGSPYNGLSAMAGNVLLMRIADVILFGCLFWSLAGQSLRLDGEDFVAEARAVRIDIGRLQPAAWRVDGNDDSPRAVADSPEAMAISSTTLSRRRSVGLHLAGSM